MYCQFLYCTICVLCVVPFSCVCVCVCVCACAHAHACVCAHMHACVCACVLESVCHVVSSFLKMKMLPFTDSESFFFLSFVCVFFVFLDAVSFFCCSYYYHFCSGIRKVWNCHSPCWLVTSKIYCPREHPTFNFLSYFVPPAEGKSSFSQ